MVVYKSGVSGQPTPAITTAINAAEGIYASFGVDLVVTSLRDGRHMTGSLHYSGNAVDFRRWDLDAKGKTSAAAAALRSQLGRCYQVLIEGDHIHVEYECAKSTPSPQPLPSPNPGNPAIPPANEQPSYLTWVIIGAVALMILRR